MKQYILNLLIAIDQLVNTLIGGWPDETLSASAYAGECAGKPLARIARPVIDWLFSAIETDHCRKAYLSEINQSQLPASYKQ